jgi:A/G-specific adenine glycosylase
VSVVVLVEQHQHYQTLNTALTLWYDAHGRHDLPWRLTRDPWPILVSEVMLQQTQAARIVAVWPAFMAEFPTPQSMARRPVGDVLTAWGRLGYPRRALRLWQSSQRIAQRGWPDDLTTLPGVGQYTAPAVAIQAWDRDDQAADVNITRVASRWSGAAVSPRAAARITPQIDPTMTSRDRFLALMDVGALVCTKRSPTCDVCPLFDGCTTRGSLPHEPVSRQPRYDGSFRQRRGTVMAALRRGPQLVSTLDDVALESLVADGLATIDDARVKARLP